ncbi:hypothetical protein BaRGS_00002876 [Batillaria attramentaria]|uniref:Uncharacterized protein n=1 Tax=Batillaria attramentaria TaxID=370345 RepID=A0ABD0M469_9CAEN
MGAKDCCRRMYFWLMVILDGTDLLSDWLLYVDVRLTEKGLVYGPPGDAVVHSLLAFSVIGTVLFLFEALNLWRDVFRGNAFVDVDLVSAITIWLEDLPQIAINVYIVWCREDPISYFQFLKAAVMLLGLVIRIFFLCGNYIHKNTRCNDSKCRRRKGYRAMVMIGLFINAALASCVFVFTQTHRQPSGDLEFQLPDTVFEDKYDDQRYFQNVSVFVHLPDFDSAHVTANNGQQVNWVRLMSINDVRGNVDDTISYKYGYQKSATNLEMALWKRVDKGGQRQQTGSWELRECCLLDLQTGSLTMVSTDVCQSPAFIAKPTFVYITFSFVKPDFLFKRRIFGDIRYNIKVGNDGKCLDYDNITDNVNQAANKPIIHYYRTAASLSTSTSHLVQDAGGPRFFRNDGDDLMDVATLWKTGWGNCESSGSGGPTLARDIVTGCD